MNRAAAGCLALLLGVATVAVAADLPDVTVRGVASGDGVRLGYGDGGNAVLAETVQLKGDRTRVDVVSGPRRFYVLRKGDTAWLVSERDRFALPVTHTPAGRDWRLDKEAPCRDGGFHCERARDARRIAGRQVVGWRFRSAGTRGPDGTDSGTLWLDADTGLVLAYQAQDMNQRHHDWTATSVEFGPLADELFELPQGIQRVPARKPGTR